MSSWLYRPTPVVAWGNGAFASQNVLGGQPNGAGMRGVVLGHNYAPGLGKAKAARTGSRQPWIKLSGTMGDFIPKGLGGLGDDASFIASMDTYENPGDTLTPPDFTPFDTSGLLNPANLLYTPQFQVTASVLPSTLTPPAGAGPTGTGIPGTQPLNPAALVGPSTSLFSSIANFFTPKPAAPANYAALPGYGGAAAPSFLAQSSILPGTPNSTVIFGALAAVMLVAVLGSGGKRR